MGFRGLSSNIKGVIRKISVIDLKEISCLTIKIDPLSFGIALSLGNPPQIIQNYLDNPGSWPLSCMNHAGDFTLSPLYIAVQWLDDGEKVRGKTKGSESTQKALRWPWASEK